MDFEKLFNLIDYYHQNKRYPKELENRKDLFDVFYVFLKNFLETVPVDKRDQLPMPVEVQLIFQTIIDLLEKQLS